MSTGTSNELSVRASIQRQINIKAGLKKLREDVMKAEVDGRSVRMTDYTQWKLPTRTVPILVSLKAIEDVRPDAPNAQGKYLKWIYKGNVDGTVDEQLVDRLIDKEKQYNREYLASKKEIQVVKGDKLLVAATKYQKKGTGIVEILQWIEDEKAKNELVPGYIRYETIMMYERIQEILTGLGELKEVIGKINL